MARMAGNSSLGVLRVQSPVAETSSIGLGANMEAISTLLVPMRRPGMFSQTSPPCMMAETMFTGAANCRRSSTAAGSAGHGDAGGIHVVERGHEIERAAGIPELQPERTEGPQLLRRTAECVRRLHRVVIAHHIPGEYDV